MKNRVIVSASRKNNGELDLWHYVIEEIPGCSISLGKFDISGDIVGLTKTYEEAVNLLTQNAVK